MMMSCVASLSDFHGNLCFHVCLVKAPKWVCNLRFKEELSYMRPLEISGCLELTQFVVSHFEASSVARINTRTFRELTAMYIKH